MTTASASVPSRLGVRPVRSALSRWMCASTRPGVTARSSQSTTRAAAPTNAHTAVATPGTRRRRSLPRFIGGALAAMAIFTQTVFLLLFIGGIFLIEALSVIVQVISFKYYGRRVFLMAPIHHHFEMKAWSETKIMVRFWIVTAILCAIGFALFYRDFTFFRR